MQCLRGSSWYLILYTVRNILENHWSEKSRVNHMYFKFFWTYVLEPTREIVEPTRSWHAWESSEQRSLEPTRRLKSRLRLKRSRLEVNRADSGRRAEMCTERRADSDWKGADSKSIEPTRAEELKCVQKEEPTLTEKELTRSQSSRLGQKNKIVNRKVSRLWLHGADSKCNSSRLEASVSMTNSRASEVSTQPQF